MNLREKFWKTFYLIISWFSESFYSFRLSEKNHIDFPGCFLKYYLLSFGHWLYSLNFFRLRLKSQERVFFWHVLSATKETTVSCGNASVRTNQPATSCWRSIRTSSPRTRGLASSTRMVVMFMFLRSRTWLPMNLASIHVNWTQNPQQYQDMNWGFYTLGKYEKGKMKDYSCIY